MRRCDCMHTRSSHDAFGCLYCDCARSFDEDEPSSDTGSEK